MSPRDTPDVRRPAPTWASRAIPTADAVRANRLMHTIVAWRARGRDRRSGTGGSRDGDASQARRLHRLHDLRAGAGDRRHVARQPLSRRGLRRALAPLLFLVRAESRLAPQVRAPARDRALPPRCVETYDLAPHVRLGTEVAGARFDDGALAHLDERRRASRRHPGVAAPASSTGRASPRCRASPTSRARVSLRTVGPSSRPAGKRIVVVGNGASAVQFVPEIARDAAHVTVLQRSPNYVIPRNDRAYRGVEKWLFRYLPGWRRALSRASSTGRSRRGSRALHRGSVMSKIVRWMALRHLRQQIAEPDAARAAHARLSDRLQAHRDLRRLVPGARTRQRLARHRRRSIASPRTPSITADGRATAADALIFATGFETHELPRADADRRQGRHDARRGVARRRRGTPRHRRRGLSEPVPPLRPEHEPRPQLDPVHDRVPGPLHLAVPRRARPPRRALARRQARGDGALQHRAAGGAREDRVGRRVSSWYKTVDGKITNNWSSRTASYWLRTRKPDFDEFDVG